MWPPKISTRVKGPSYKSIRCCQTQADKRQDWQKSVLTGQPVTHVLATPPARYCSTQTRASPALCPQEEGTTRELLLHMLQQGKRLLCMLSDKHCIFPTRYRYELLRLPWALQSRLATCLACNVTAVADASCHYRLSDRNLPLNGSRSAFCHVSGPPLYLKGKGSPGKT